MFQGALAHAHGRIAEHLVTPGLPQQVFRGGLVHHSSLFNSRARQADTLLAKAERSDKTQREAIAGLSRLDLQGTLTEQKNLM